MARPSAFSVTDARSARSLHQHIHCIFQLFPCNLVFCLASTLRFRHRPKGHHLKRHKPYERACSVSRSFAAACHISSGAQADTFKSPWLFPMVPWSSYNRHMKLLPHRTSSFELATSISELDFSMLAVSSLIYHFNCPSKASPPRSSHHP